MNHIIAENSDNTTTIQVNFTDEGINLQGETTVKGGETEALRYMQTFESDLRRNFADMFPIPEMPAPPEGGMLE